MAINAPQPYRPEPLPCDRSHVTAPFIAFILALCLIATAGAIYGGIGTYAADTARREADSFRIENAQLRDTAIQIRRAAGVNGVSQTPGGVYFNGSRVCGHVLVNGDTVVEGLCDGGAL